MMEVHKPEKVSVPKRLTKHSIEHLTSPGSDCENNSDGMGPSSPKKHKENSEKIVSYTEMIAKAIFASPNNMSTLAEIYNYLIVKYPILSSRGKSWKNSVRHTLSLNEWFVKIPKLDNAKCCYWSIHPVYIQRFRRGDFQKQRKASVTKICSNPNQRYYDLGYDISPTLDYHFMPPSHYQPEISSGISPHGSFSPWPMHRPYEEMQPNFFPSTSHYSPFQMYNMPPPPFPSMYNHDTPFDHQQYTNITPNMKQENGGGVDKYMHGGDSQNYRSEQQSSEYYGKHENNNQQCQQQQSKNIDVSNIITNAIHHDHVIHPQSHVNNTLNLLSNAALSTQHAMNLTNNIGQNQVNNTQIAHQSDVNVTTTTFNDTVKRINGTTDNSAYARSSFTDTIKQINITTTNSSLNPSSNQQIGTVSDSSAIIKNQSSAVTFSIQNPLLQSSTVQPLSSLTCVPTTTAFPQSFSSMLTDSHPIVNNTKADDVLSTDELNLESPQGIVKETPSIKEEVKCEPIN